MLDPSTPTAAPDQIPRRVLEAFGVEPTAASQTVRAARIVEDAVIKPVDDAAEATWCADLFETLDLGGVRLPRLLRSPAGASRTISGGGPTATPGTRVALATTGGVHPLQALLTRLDGLRVPTPARRPSRPTPGWWIG